MPNECWQSDFTHYRLATASTSRSSAGSTTAPATPCTSQPRRITTPIVLATFRETAGQHGIPASTLTDNGMVYTVRHSGGRGGRNAFEARAAAWQVVAEERRPNTHYLRQGGEIQQTLKKWLRAQPVQPETIAELQTLIDDFVETYNGRRPHRSLPIGRPPQPSTKRCPKPSRPRAVTPTPTTGSASTRSARPERDPARARQAPPHRNRANHKGTHVSCSPGPRGRIVNAITGELIRELTIDLTRDYQPHRPK